ncbi:N-alpha-acetyltransferase 20 [Hypoxylon texense]
MPPTSRQEDSHYKRHVTPTATASGRRSVMSVRSFAAFEKVDLDVDDGASIPDILGRCASLGTSVAETVASPTTFRKIWAETENLALMNSQLSNTERLERPAEIDVMLNLTKRVPFQLLQEVSNANSSSSSIGLGANSALLALQSISQVEPDGLEALVEGGIDRRSYNLISPFSNIAPPYSLETRSKALFSTDHLRIIFDDPLLFQKFTDFLYTFKPKSAPALGYYLDTIKALQAISYANSITRALTPIKGIEFTEGPVSNIIHEPLLKKANEVFQTLAREYLPAYITHLWVRIVNATIKKKIAGTLPVNPSGLLKGSAEVFYLTDPSQHDNPIVFASKDYAFGRNCRFLQGPNTNASSVRRIKEHLEAGKEHCETFLSYRRDGSPFMNLLMVAPLFDSQGVVRYHLGAQIDVSGLAKECVGLESLRRLVEQKHSTADLENGEGTRMDQSGDKEFYKLAEKFSPRELDIVRQVGGAAHYTRREEAESIQAGPSLNKPTPLVGDDLRLKQHSSNPMANISATSGSRLPCIYEHYLLVRPHPHLRVLFASPSMRVPGILQSSFMSRIGGSQAVREGIVRDFANGGAFTAKVRWVNRTDSRGKGRWVHCTPLLGPNRGVGVWMVVLVDDEAEAKLRRARVAPPVDLRIGRQQPFDEEVAGSWGGEGADRDANEHPQLSVPKSAAEENRNPPASMSAAR